MSGIPVKKLTQGRERSSKHIESLLKSSQILYDSKQYAHSLSFSILAREEIQKLSPQEYEALKIQRERLGATRGTVSYEEAMTLTPDYDKLYEKFDQIKQESFYLGWNGNFFTLFTRLDLNELQGLAFTHLMTTKQHYHTTISIHIHKEITPDVELIIKNDTNFKEYLKIRHEIQSAHSRKLVRLSSQAINKLTQN